MRIAIIGAGYVGLTTAGCLAELGHEVACHDVDAGRIAQLSNGSIPIHEPGLISLIRRMTAAERLRFPFDPDQCVASAEVVFLTVGTPSAADGDIDLSQVTSAARRIAPFIQSGAVVVIKSTVAAGTCRRIREAIAGERQSLDFSVASNPEFLREGSAIEDFMRPDRVVIGADDEAAAAILREIYRPLEQRGVPVLLTSTTNAEMIKHASNAFLALKIGFINDVAQLCEAAGGDVSDVAEGIGLDRRIGRSFLAPGPGYGGSCFPKDTRSFAAIGRNHGAPQHLIETLIARNENYKALLADRILKQAKLGAGNRVGVLGLAFKANTDDIREAPALTIIPILQANGVTVSAHDPEAGANALRHLPGIELAASPYAAARNADAVVILTEWDCYRRLDLARLAEEMRGRILFDYRNLLVPEDAVSHDIAYAGLGRRLLAPEVGVCPSDLPKEGGGPAMERWVSEPWK